VTASNAWPNFYLRDGREVDKQVAVPPETRTPNLHRLTLLAAVQSPLRDLGLRLFRESRFSWEAFERPSFLFREKSFSTHKIRPKESGNADH